MKTLNAFLKRRPPIEILKTQGILTESIFGANLIYLCKKEKRSGVTNVPLFVEQAVQTIESKGLDMDGIYRISGNLVEVQKVRQLVEHGKYSTFKDFDIHVLCGALKTFFRELEDPLIPVELQPAFLNTTKMKNKSEQLTIMQELIKKLPLSHRETLRYLLIHLLKVVSMSKENRMSVQNVALVFGPNLMRSDPSMKMTSNDSKSTSNPMSIIGGFGGFNPNIMTQNVVVEYMIQNFNELYSFQTNSIFTEYRNHL